jgi:hypothetical protein
MATYLSGIYGLPLYGDRTTTTYYDSKIVAWAYDYNAVFVKWQNITYNPNYTPILYWRLTRTNTGTPDNPFAGDLVTGGAIESFLTSYTDYLSADVTTQTVYSLWVFDGLRWVFCGSSTVNILVDSNSLLKVSRWIPRAWLNAIQGTGDITGEPGSTDLEHMLSGFVFEYDRLRGEIELLSKASSTVYAPNQLLKNKIEELGFTYEPTLGDTYHRSLYNSGNLINSDKGTLKGLAGYITALTHWNSKITVGHNLMLDYNDSSFEENTGNWSSYIEGTDAGAPGSLLSQHLYANNATSGGELGVAINPPSPNLYDHTYTPRNLGFGVISTSATSTVSIWLPDEEYTATTTTIPIKQNTRYIFTGWVKQLDATTATVTASIYWYDRVGNIIGTTPAGPSLATTTGWNEFTSYCSTARNGYLSPVNAVYAGLRLYVTPSSATTARYAVDMFMLCEPENSLEYQDARRINIAVAGDLENYILNPSFEEGVGFWTASYNGSFAQDPTISPSSLVWPLYNVAAYNPNDPAQYLSAHVGELTAFPNDGTHYDPAWITSDWIPVDPGQNYTFSGSISSDDTQSVAIARIEFSNKITADQQDHTLSDSNGQYFDPSVYYVDSIPFNFAGSIYTDPLSGQPALLPVKTRFYVTGIAPQTTTDSGQPMAKVSVYFPHLPNNPPGQLDRTMWFDGLLLQDAITVPILDDAGNPVLDFAGNPTVEINSYFDGTGGPIPTNPVKQTYLSVIDSSWETKTRTNFLSNPSFETLDSWTGYNTHTNTSITLSNQSDNGGFGVNPNFPANWEGRRYINPDGSYGLLVTEPSTGQPKLFYYPPRYGSYNLVVNYAPNFLVGGVPVTHYGVTELENPNAENIYSYIETTAYLPSPAVGGEDVTISMYVRGSEGRYILSAYTGAFATTADIYNKTIKVVQHDQYQWIRIQVVRQLKSGETSFTIRLGHTSEAAYSSPGKIPQSGYFVVDGAQAEYGRVASSFVDPSDSGTVVISNPSHTSSNIYLTMNQNAYAGKSSYHNNWTAKSTRLAANLPSVLPYGSTWSLQRGDLLNVFASELSGSLIPSASFEKDLGSWAGIRSTLTRKYALGSLFSDSLVHGTAYAEVTTTNTDPFGDLSFGITTDFIPVKSGHGYYASVAIKPENLLSEGVYTMHVDFYAADKSTLIAANERYTITNLEVISNVAYIDIGPNNIPTGGTIVIQGLPLSGFNGTFTVREPGLDQPSNIVAFAITSPNYPSTTVSGVVTYDVTNSTRVVSQSINQLNRWAYLGLVNPGQTTVGAAYAKVSVICTPNSLDATQAFKIDKAVFRE